MTQAFPFFFLAREESRIEPIAKRHKPASGVAARGANESAGRRGRTGNEARGKPDRDPGKRDDVGQDLMVEVDQAQHEHRGHERHERYGAQRRPEL